MSRRVILATLIVISILGGLSTKGVFNARVAARRTQDK